LARALVGHSSRTATDDELPKGDKVTWQTHGTKTEGGTVRRKITSETEAAGRAVKADHDNPQYLVESDKSGRDAVHKPAALDRKDK
jgi:Hypervirulence associated proteins TUDOR domain